MGNEALKPVEDLTFREAMAELDGIVGVLESNTLELEDSLASYERGVALLRALQGRLATAQQKVDVLMGQLEPEVGRAARYHAFVTPLADRVPRERRLQQRAACFASTMSARNLLVRRQAVERFGYQCGFIFAEVPAYQC